MDGLLWLDDLEANICRFLGSVGQVNSPGRYLPCRLGATTYGKGAELGFSCFALKLYYSFGWWDAVSSENKEAWVNHINSFQNNSEAYGEDYRSSYVDPVLINYLRKPSLSRYISWTRSTSARELFKILFYGQYLQAYQRAIVAETKQAIATLAQIGAESKKAYGNFPQSPEGVDKHMSKFDWSLPWDAGGQTASLAVFLSTQGPRILSLSSVIELRVAMCHFYRKLVDSTSGGYFQSTTPPLGLLVNGAMKVLTALDWLDEQIHYPQQLIDTTLQNPPRPDGCHLVDAVYVLYRCALQTEYRRIEVERYLRHCLDMIQRHQHEDGGFSYSVGEAQRWYYGLPISKGLNEGDIHGTVLLVWALTMITQILWPARYSWKVIRP